MAPKPVNVLVGSDFTTVAELAAIGVRRISVGGALARAAWTGFIAAATEIAERGTFTGLAGASLRRTRWAVRQKLNGPSWRVGRVQARFRCDDDGAHPAIR